MSYRFTLYSAWSSSGRSFANPIPPAALPLDRAEFIAWLDEVITGRWWFEAEMTAYEYDTGQTEHTVYVFYEEPRDAFLHRMRW